MTAEALRTESARKTPPRLPENVGVTLELMHPARRAVKALAVAVVVTCVFVVEAFLLFSATLDR